MFHQVRSGFMRLTSVRWGVLVGRDLAEILPQLLPQPCFHSYLCWNTQAEDNFKVSTTHKLCGSQHTPAIENEMHLSLPNSELSEFMLVAWSHPGGRFYIMGTGKCYKLGLSFERASLSVHPEQTWAVSFRGLLRCCHWITREYYYMFYKNI